MMLVISEEIARDLVSAEAAITAVEECFAAMARGQARNYPVVREVVGMADAVYGVKAGADSSARVLGLKAGGYWPGNAARGLTNHQSATLLFDADSGRASALVSANYLTGVRTGAASAIAAKHLARPDAHVLGIVGTGGQSLYQLRATRAVRPIDEVHAWDPSPANLARFEEEVAALGLRFTAHKSAEGAASAADVVITVTPSRQPLIRSGWLRPGTHVSAMGADTKGKQELDPNLVSAAALFVDEIDQARTIGEFQHAFALGLIDDTSIRASLGAVVAGLALGRKSPDEITIFDGTGVALQDLVVADLAVKLARAKGLGTAAPY